MTQEAGLSGGLGAFSAPGRIPGNSRASTILARGFFLYFETLCRFRFVC